MLMQNLIGTIKESFKNLKSKKIFFPISLDILFFLIYGFIGSALFGKITEYITAIGVIFAKSSGKMMNEMLKTKSFISALLANSEIVFYIKRIIILSIITGIIFYMLYSLFHGLSWKICSELSKNKRKKENYLKKFFIINLFWGFLFLIQRSFSLFYELKNTAMKSINPFYTSKIIFPNILLWIIVYFALLSYALLQDNNVKKALKKCFVIGIKKLPGIALMYIVVVFIFLAINYLLFLSSKLSSFFAFIIGVGLLIPSFSYVRIFMLKTLEKISKEYT